MQIRVAIAVSDDSLGRLDEVASACNRLGFQVDVIVTRMGIMTGSIESDKFSALSAVPGVATVEREQAGRIERSP